MADAAWFSKEYGGYHLKSYIERLQSRCVEGNSADYKVTTNSELDEIESNARTQFARAVALYETLDDATIRRAQRLEEHKENRYIPYRLGRFAVDGKWVVGPWWMERIDEVKLLLKVLA